MRNPYLEFMAERGFALCDPNFENSNQRNDICAEYAYAIPNEEALLEIKKYSPRGVVEVGAGGGYWAMMLRALGVNVLAFDTEPDPRDNSWVTRQWSEVCEGGSEVAARHPERTLFLCWPRLYHSMAYDALSYYVGNMVIYVGEGEGGCTANDAFHETLNNGVWREVADIDIPQWDCINDGLWIYKRVNGG